MSDKATGLGSPEYDELLKDLNQYDNPEAFYDASTSQPYSFRVNSKALDQPNILRVELDGVNVFRVVREMILAMLKKGREQELDSGETTWEDVLAEVMADDEYLQAEREVYWFFVRNLPKLVVRVYDILMHMSVGFTVKSLVDSESEPATKEEKKAVESAVRLLLTTKIRELQNDLKRMVGTRPRGGKQSKLEPDLRQRLHLHYESLYEQAKPIKKQYNALRKTFEANRNRSDRAEWEKFWLDYATKLYSNYDADYLNLYASIDNPSASVVAYRWLSLKTNLTQSYVQRIVKELRQSARKAAQERDVETN